MSRILWIICGVYIFLLLILIFARGGLPIGYDHGMYVFFIDKIWEKSFFDLPVFLQQQFEIFYASIVQYISSVIDPVTWVTWWIWFVYVMTWLSVYLFFRTMGSHPLVPILAMTLFFFSIVQYQVVMWGFGKQILATFFLFTSLIYRSKKISIFVVFMLFAIMTHRLTGFVGGIICGMLFLVDSSSKRWMLLLPIWLGLVHYIPTWTLQISPIFHGSILWVFLTQGVSGSLFTPHQFWLIAWIEIVVVIGLFSVYAAQDRYRAYSLYFLMSLFWIIGSLIVLRIIGFNRLGSFLDLSLLGIIALMLPVLRYRWVSTIIILQMMVSWIYVWYMQRPWITPQEYELVTSVKQYIPDDAVLVNLDFEYVPWLFGYSWRRVWNPFYWEGSTYDPLQIPWLISDPETLCGFLWSFQEPVYVYYGFKSRAWSLRYSSCLWPDNDHIDWLMKYYVLQ